MADSAEDIPKTVDSTSNNDGRSGQLNISRTAATGSVWYSDGVYCKMGGGRGFGELLGMGQSDL